MVEELMDSAKQDIKSVTRKLTGFRRRQFQAEMMIKYSEGHPHRAEQVLG